MQKGNCYQSAYDAFMNRRDFPEKDGWRLVHGIAVLSGGRFKGHTFGHAWLENLKKHIVYDAEKDMILPTLVFYKIGKISFSIEYKKSDVAKMAVKHGHYGPWNKKIWDADPKEERFYMSRADTILKGVGKEESVNEAKKLPDLVKDLESVMKKIGAVEKDLTSGGR